MIQRVDHVEINVPDIDEAVDFYTKVLGFKLWRRVRSETPDGGVLEIAGVVLDDFMIEILKARDLEVDQTSVGVKLIALRVDDMAKTIADLRSKGVQVAAEPRESRSFNGLRAEIMDPSGVHIELREWRNDGLSNDDWQPGQPGVSRLA
jgi:lactoylglutathione lyase